uniref:Uncharacterized protein n=1 Tax=Anguilla anguilla TaxID=7936 RepID=A0A0E9RXY6_ANGAN
MLIVTVNGTKLSDPSNHKILLCLLFSATSFTFRLFCVPSAGQECRRGNGSSTPKGRTVTVVHRP